MPNILDANGLQVKTRDELIAQFTAAFQAIYGPDINLDQDSPDGQLMNLFVQEVLDLEDLLVQVFNSFSPDSAIGVVLDQRVAINGIQRQAGTKTVTNITLVLSQSVNLYGVDQSIQPVYTVADNDGTEWQLQTTQLGIGPGTVVLSFEAKNPGATLTTPNTITVPVTIVLGVTSINNPTSYTTLGLDEESDAALRIRRQRSVALSSQGYLAGLIAALENINGLTFVYVRENTDAATDIYGVPGHSLWVIVAGTAADADVAQAIYSKRSAGCGLYNSGGLGAKEYTITQIDGTPFLVKWDTVQPETLYIKFTATSLDGTTPPNVAAIRSGLVNSFVPGVGLNGVVNVNELATQVQDIDPNTLVTGAGFSTSPTGPFTNTLAPSNLNNQFAVSEANIIIIPMVMSPASAIVAALGTKQFTAYGGFGAYTWSMVANPSGGSVSPAGLYTAGATTGVTDIVRATDTQGNFIDAAIQVV